MAKQVKDSGYVAKAQLSNVRVTPQKARLVADLVRGRKVSYALQVLQFSQKKTAPLLKKLLMSAVANAKERAGVDVDELYVRSIWVGEGRKNNRWMPRAQGRATPIIKRHSHINVVLDEISAKKK